MTVQTKATLQSLLATNGVNAITASRLLDFLDSVMPVGRTATAVVAANDSTTREKVNADYVCDGTADQTEIQAAIDSLDTFGGSVILCPGTYNLSAGILIDANKRIQFSAWGALLVPAASVTAIRVSQGTGGNTLGCLLDGILIDGSSINGQTGVEFRDTDRATLQNFRIKNCAVGVLFRSEAASVGWVEGAELHRGLIEQCTTGWNATVGAGTGSFGETIVHNVGINGCTTAINWQANSNFYRSTLSGLTIWLNDNQTGWTINGNVRGVRGDIAFESLDGTPTGINAITLSSSASNTMSMNLDIDFEGSFTNRIVDASSKYIQFRWNGIHYMNHVDAGRLLRARVVGDTSDRFGVIANAAAGGGMVIGNGAGDIFYMVGEAQDLLRITGAIQFPEMGSEPGAPPANNAKLYAIDDGAKTELRSRFATGAVQQITQEP